MRNLKLVLSYDGTQFSGWQRQADQRTVQQTLEEAIAELTGVECPTNASGRTDAGVHALGQVVNFRTDAGYPPEVFLRALNAVLPREVRVLDSAEVPLDFHATLDARSKLYRYVIDNRAISDPFQLRYSLHVVHPLDSDAMQRGGQALVGTHDFRGFETHYPNRTTSVRTITHLSVSRTADTIRLEVEADGFLYNMVRAITGTLVLVGSGKWREERVAEVLAAQDRRETGPNAPPQGLFLVRVRYEDW